MRQMGSRVSSRLGVLLVLASMVSGVAAGTAAAELPEFESVAPQSFALNGSEVTFETAQKNAIRCKTFGGGAALTNFKEGSVQMVFKECKSALGTTCTSSGAAAGEIKAATLTWRLVYISKAAHEVGFVINYQEPFKVTTVATANCGGLLGEETIRGTVIAKITPINTRTKSFTLGLKGALGVQEFTQYENAKSEKVKTLLELGGLHAPFEEADLNVAALKLEAASETKILA